MCECNEQSGWVMFSLSISPHSVAHFAPLMRADPPPPGEGETLLALDFSRCRARLFVQLIGQMGPHGRPFRGEDAVAPRVAHRPLVCVWVVAKNPVDFSPEPLDTPPRL